MFYIFLHKPSAIATSEVTSDDESATIRGKVWKRGEAEPQGWTISKVDPHPIRAGSPGLSGYSPATIYFDNIEVTSNR